MYYYIFLPLKSADYAKGFGGKFGVETDKVDKSAVGFEYQGKTEKHESQKGLSHIFYTSLIVFSLTVQMYRRF